MVLQISKMARIEISPALQSDETVITAGLTYNKSNSKVALLEVSNAPNHLLDAHRNSFLIALDALRRDLFTSPELTKPFLPEVSNSKCH